MGLSSWIQKMLDRPRRDRNPREDSLQLFLTRLEDRRVLNAAFALNGVDSLVLDNFSQGTDENLTIRENGANYEFELSEGTWAGTDGGGVTGNGNAILEVQKSVIDNLIQVDGAAINVDINFQTVDFSGLTGGLELTDVGGVTQDGASTVQVSTFMVSGISLTLNEATNDFGTVDLTITNDATLQDANNLTLGTVSTGDAFQVTAAGVTTLTGDINTDADGTAGDLTISADVVLGSNVTIDTDGTTSDGAVSITGTINGTSGENLTVTSDSGAVNVQGDIGTTTAIGDLDINATAGTGTITLQNIGSAGTAGANSALIGNNSSTSLSLQGTQYVTAGSQVYRAATDQQLNGGGTVTFQNTGTAGGDVIEFRGSGIALSNDTNLVVQTAGGIGDNITVFTGITGVLNETVVLTGGRVNLGPVTGVRNITTSGSSGQLSGSITTSSATVDNFVLFNQAYVIPANPTIDTSAGNGDITLNARLQASNGNDITLNAGTGTITATQIGVGANSTQRFNDITITAATFNLSQSLLATSETGDAADLAITVNAFNVTNTVSINVFDNSGGTETPTLTVTGPINSAGQELNIDLGMNNSSAITLTNAANDFGTLGLIADNATIVESDSLILNDVNVLTAFALTVTSGTSTQAAGTSISGLATGFTKNGAGLLDLNETNTYTGTTTINTGELRVTGEIGNGGPAGTVTVNTGTTLSGTGIINAPVSVQNGGTLSPGTSPGILSTNDLTLDTGSTFLAELNSPYQTAGTDYDQVNVNGTVTLNNATLQLQGGAIAPAPGTTVILIANDGTDAVNGTFNGLAQGDTVTVGSFTATITYRGGDGNDVALEVDGPFTFNNTGGGDVTVRQNTTNDTYEIVKGGTVVATRLRGGVDEIIINGDATTSDTLTIDFGTGGFFAENVTFNGGEGAGDNDTLIITGGTFDRVEHNFTGAEAGNILYDVDGNTGTTTDQATIVYTQLEPVDMTGSTITDLVFNLPAGDDQAVLEDEGTGGNNISQIRSANATFETTTFMTPTGSLLINLGDGNDTLTIADLPDFSGPLTIVGQAGTDTVSFDGAVDFGTGNLSVTSEAINLTNNANLQTSGNINFDADQTAAATFAGISADGATVTTTGAGTITLTGRGGNTGDDNVGVFINNSQITTADGSLTVNGVGVGAGNNNHGVQIAGTSVLTTGTGDIDVNGTAGVGADSRSVFVQDSATIGNLTTTGTVDVDGNAGVIEFQGTSAIQTANATATAATVRDATNVILGNISAVNGDTRIGVDGQITGAVTQLAGSSILTNNITFNTDISTATPITLDSATNQIATVGATQRGGTLLIRDSAGGLTVNGPLNFLATTDDSVSFETAGGDLLINLPAAFTTLSGGNITLTTDAANSVIIDEALTVTNGTGNIDINGGTAVVSQNLQTDGGNIDFQGTTIVTLAASIVLDTESGNDGNAGSVLFSTGTNAAINATTAGTETLTINTVSTGGTDGNVSLSDIGTGTRLGNVSVTAGDGTITLNDTSGVAGLAEVLTDNGSVTFGSFLELTANTLIDTMGGLVNLTNTEVFSDAGGPHNLTIDTDGGNVQLGRFIDNGVNFVNDLSIDTTGGVDGTLAINADITLAGNFTHTGGTATFQNTGRIIATGNQVTITSSGAIVDNTALEAADGAQGVNITAAGISLQAVNGIGSDTGNFGDAGDIDINGTTLTAINTAAGSIQIFEVDDIAINDDAANRVDNGTRTVVIDADGAITDNDLTTEGATNENIIAGSLLLRAVNGIGSSGGVLDGTTDLDINVTNLTAVNTAAGNIEIFEVDNLAINDGGANARVDNGTRTVVIDAGGAITDATNVANDTNANIVAEDLILRANNGIGSGVATFADGADLDIQATTLSAQNVVAGQIQITDVDDIQLVQVSNPGRTVLIGSGGAITDSTPVAGDAVPNIIAANAALLAVTGIGGPDTPAADTGNDIDTDVTTISAQTMTGPINLRDISGLIIGNIAGLNGVQVTMASTDDIDVIANGDFTVNNQVTHAGTGDIRLTALDPFNLNINANVTTNAPGNIALEGENITLTSTVRVIGDSVIATVTPRNGLVTGTGIISFDADTLVTLGAGSRVQSDGGIIQFTTDDIAIANTAVVTTDVAMNDDGVVIIRNQTDGRNIELGGVSGGGVLNLSDAELDRITSETLRIGRRDGTNANNITFNGAFTASDARIDLLQLFAAGDILQGTGSVSANRIGLDGTGQVALGGNGNDAITALAIRAVNDVVFTDINNLTINQVADAIDTFAANDGEDGISGVVSTAGFVDLSTQVGNLTVADGITVEANGDNAANNLTVNLTAGGANSFLNLNANSVVTGVNATMGEPSNVRFTADNMRLDGTASVIAPTSASLRNFNVNVTIDLGADDNVTDLGGRLELTDAELSIFSTPLLAIGRNTGNVSGAINISGTIQPDGMGAGGTPTTLHLITPAMITDVATGAILETNLILESGAGVNLGAGAHDVDVLTGRVTTAGASFVFRDIDDLIVGTATGLSVTNNANEPVGQQVFTGITTNGQNGGGVGGDVTITTNSTTTVNAPITTTANSLGRSSGNIVLNVAATGNLIVNQALTTTGTTVGGNGQGGDITGTTADGTIIINAPNGTLNALGGGPALVDGGNITLDANGQNSDVSIIGNLQTNDVVGGVVRGSITIAADDTVTIGNGAVATQIQTTGSGTIMVLANQSNLDGDNDGVIAMQAMSQITADQGAVTLRTGTVNDADNGSISVTQITTTTGIVTVDANGQNADVTFLTLPMPAVNRNIQTTNGNIIVNADDSVFFQTGSTLFSTGTGSIQVVANTDAADGDGADEILMNDGSLIQANTGILMLQNTGANGGNITIERIVTQNATADAIQIRTAGAVVDADNDEDDKDIQADAGPNARVLIEANTGVGAGADPNADIETQAVRFDITNQGNFDINIDNMTDGDNVFIERISTLGPDADVTFNQADLTPATLPPGVLTIGMFGISTGNITTPVVGGNIAVTTDGDLVVAARLSTLDGKGGTFTMNGGVTFNAGSSIQLGTGNITLTSTSAQDIIVSAGTNLTIDNGSAIFNAPRDVIVSGRITTRAESGTTPNTFVDATLVADTAMVTSDLQLNADTNSNGTGGVLIQEIGQVIVSGNLVMRGSNLFDDSLVTNLPLTIQNGVHIEKDLVPATTQVRVSGNSMTTGNALEIRNNQFAGADSQDIVLGGVIRVERPAAGTASDILIDANNNVHIADDTTVFSQRGNIVFGDAATDGFAGVDRDAVIDDGVNLTSSNLVVTSQAGIVRFRGRIGDDVTNIGTQNDRITSLNVTAGQNTQLLGGYVSTLANQTFVGVVLLDAETDLAASTTFTAGGDVSFQNAVRGLDTDPGTFNTPGIEDDLVLNVTGTTIFAGQVGGDFFTGTFDLTQRIGDGLGHAIVVNSTGQTFFNSQVFTESGVMQANGAGRITFRENVYLNQGDSDSEFLGNVNLDSMTLFSNGNLTFGSAVLNSDILNVEVSSRISTVAVMNITVGGMNRVLDANATGDRNITINSRLTDTVVVATQNEDLNFDLGMGNLLMNGSVGVANTNRFGDLVVERVNDFTFGPSTTQTMFAESLTQFTGTGTTRLDSQVLVTAQNAVTIATNDVVFNNLVDAQSGGRVRVQADEDFTITVNSLIRTNGGDVIAEALGGELIMEESVNAVGAIDAGFSNGGNVVLEANGILSVGQIRSGGGFVSLTSNTSSIHDNGDASKNLPGTIITRDIQAARLRFQAAQGVGVSFDMMNAPVINGFEIMVSNLEANNGTNGIHILNLGGLTIGGLDTFAPNTFQTVETTRTNNVVFGPTLPTFTTTTNNLLASNLNGVRNVSGDVNITASGPLTINEDVVNLGTNTPNSNINLQATSNSGRITVNQSIDTTDALDPVKNLRITNIQSDNGSVTMNAGTDVNAGLNTQISANKGNVGINSALDSFFRGEVLAMTDTPMMTEGNVNVMAGRDFELQTGLFNQPIIQSTNGNVVVNASRDVTAESRTNIFAVQGSIDIDSGVDSRFRGEVKTMGIGNIDLMALGDLSLENSGFVDARIETDTGEIKIEAQQNVRTFGSTFVGTNQGNIDIDSGVDTLIGAIVQTLTVGNIDVEAGQNFTLSVIGTVFTQGTVFSDAFIQTNTGNVRINAMQNVTANAGTGIRTNVGNIDIDSMMDSTFRGVVQTMTAGSVDVMSQGNFELLNATANPMEVPLIQTTNGRVDLNAMGTFETSDFTMIMADQFLGINTPRMNPVTNTMTTSGNVTLRGHVQGLSNADVFIRTDGNFLLVNGFMDNEIQVSGGTFTDESGAVFIEAQGLVQFAPGPTPVIRSGTGAIRSPIPRISTDDIDTPPITNDGFASLTFTVGELGEQNFVAIVDWGDGTTTIATGLDGAIPHTITHTYTENPTPNNPSADVVVHLVILTDPNINVRAANFDPQSGAGIGEDEGNPLFPLSPLPNQSPAPPSGLTPSEDSVGNPVVILNTLNPLLQPVLGSDGLFTPQSNIQNGGLTLSGFDGNPNPGLIQQLIDANEIGFVTFDPVFNVPFGGFGNVAEIEEEELPPFFVPAGASEALPDTSNESVEDAEELEFAGSDAEEKGEGDVRVLLYVLSPSGRKLYEYEINETYLSNPAPLWAKLPDGRYQIVVVEPGRSIPIVVRDVELKQHQVIRRFDRTRKPANDEASQNETPQNQEAVSLQLPPKSIEAGDTDSSVSDNAGDDLWENWQRKGFSRKFAPANAEPESTDQSTAVAAAAVVGGVAVKKLNRNGAESTDEQMSQFTRGHRSPGRKLRRRFRKG